ncbi:MAG: cupin domain-containing protein [Pseudomonadota bacterium]
MSKAVPTLQIDNERTRVTRWDFAPGAATGEHVHEYDYCIVPLMDGAVRVVNHDGSEGEAVMKQGESYFRPKGVHHDVINASDMDFAFVEIEYK